jgi:hypothetical protein
MILCDAIVDALGDNKFKVSVSGSGCGIMYEIVAVSEKDAAFEAMRRFQDDVLGVLAHNENHGPVEWRDWIPEGVEPDAAKEVD